MVVGNVSYKIYCPSLVRTIAKVCLIVKECRFIFAISIERSEKVFVGLVSDAVAPCHLLVGQANVCARTKK